MHPTPPLRLAGAFLGLPFAFACQSTEPAFESQDQIVDVDAPPRANPAAAPMVHDDSTDSVFEYLVARYDADDDGALTEAEYTRKESQFDKWDRDGDGRISAQDFERDDDDAGGRPRPGMEAMMARRMVARYFQTDDDAGLTARTEARDALASVYDGSGGEPRDGRVSEEEFRCAMEARRREVPGDGQRSVQRAMGDADPWETIAGVVDGDGDGTLSAAELDAFYALLDTEEIDYRGWDEPRQGGGRSARAEDEPDGAREGERAPDFTLSSPDGETTATLSDFAGVRPVALIFGSYT